ncbi:Smt3-specific protease [Tulasnella sp. 419]|nr:Smt3-specific protease [Tulasnella sp. 419]
MSTGKLKTGIHITNSGMVQKLEGCTDVDHWFKKIDVFSLEHLIVPVNVNSNHWAVHKAVEARLTQGLLPVLEFLCFELRSTNQIILDWLKSHWGRKDTTSKGAFVAVKWASGQLLMFDDTPEQVDNWNCGIYACAFIEVLAQGKLPTGSEGFTFTAANEAAYQSQMMQAHLSDNLSMSSEVGNVLQTPVITYEPPSSPSPTPATPPQSYGVQKLDALASTPTSVVTEEKLPKKRPVDAGADTLPPAKHPLLSVEQSPHIKIPWYKLELQYFQQRCSQGC